MASDLDLTLRPDTGAMPTFGERLVGTTAPNTANTLGTLGTADTHDRPDLVQVKKAAAALIDMIYEFANDARAAGIAIERIEEATMWATKAITASSDGSFQ